MKKIIYFLFISFIVFSIIMVFLFNNYRPEIIKKPSKHLPKGTFWYGGADGGRWFNLIKLSNRRYYITIYASHDGLVHYKGVFILTGKMKTLKEIKKLFDGFDEFVILLKDGTYLKKEIYPKSDKKALEIIFPGKKFDYR